MCACKEKQMDVELIAPVLAKYRETGGNLISILQAAQDAYGYLSHELLLYIAKETGIKPAKIIGVATFYTQFRMKPVGKNLILLCQGTACHVNGSGAIEDAIKAETGVIEGEITPDGLFTYNNVACLGCCSLAPVMMINGETYGSLTPETTRQIIKDIRNSG
jgi:NADH-quinone oxidoreductase subunit E